MTVQAHVVAPALAGGAAALGWLVKGRTGDGSDPPVDACTSGTDGRAGRGARDDEPVSGTVVRRVAARVGVPPAALDPSLSDAVDPDALEVLVGSAGSTVVTFEFHGYEVTVTGDGGVFVGDR